MTATNRPTGLTSADAAQRLDTYGRNELRATTTEPTWLVFLRQFQDPLVYLLFIAMAISCGAWFIEGSHGVPIDTVVIGLIVIANAILGFTQEQRAAHAVAALARMTAAHSTVLRDGKQTVIPSEELVPGDILLLAEGDAVGADAKLISATNLAVQESSLTGESEAVIKDPSPTPENAPLGDRTDMVFKGTAVVRGVGTAEVMHTGMETQMGQIATMLDETEAEDSPLKKEIATISRTLGLLVVGIAVIVMVTLALVNGVHSTKDAVDILLLGVSLAVAAVPEGLPAILSLVLALGVQAMARRNAVMKNLPSVETLGSASVVCSDKTGTLTRNEMTLREIVTASGSTILEGSGYDPSGDATSINDNARIEAELTMVAGATANNAQLEYTANGWEIVGDPTEAAFLVALPKVVLNPDPAPQRLGEIPFSSERKMMTVLVPGYLYSKGAPDVLLEHCAREQVGNSERELEPGRREAILDTVEELSRKGYRTLGVARRTGLVALEEDDLTFLGVVGIIDPPRDEAKEAIEQAHHAGIRTIMITGDHPVTASSIATSLGFDATAAFTGKDIDDMSDQEFAEAVRTTDVYARVAPAHKLRIVDALQADGNIVAMTGDGVNDAPALKSADIGVAMGITGTEVTKEAATMILADDNYGTIVSAVEQGRVTFDNIRKFLRYLLSSNMGEVVTVFFGVLLAGWLGLNDSGGGVVLPLLATQILWINLITDSGPALAMGVDPADDDVMERAPRRINDRIINRDMWAQVIYIGVIMGAVTLATIDFFLPGGIVNGHDSLEVARTAGFTTLVFAQLFNALNARSDIHSAFIGIFRNRWLWASIGIAVFLQVCVVHIPFLQAAFGTASLDFTHWVVAIGMASLVLCAEEMSKFVRWALEV